MLDELRNALAKAQAALEVHAGTDSHSLGALNEVDRAQNAIGGKGAAWTPTHRHRKGGAYRELLRGTREHDLAPVVIYEGSDGTVWTRPVAEFDDGRFTRIDGVRNAPT